MLSTEQFKASKRYLDFFLQASYTSLYLPIPPYTSLYLPCKPIPRLLPAGSPRAHLRCISPTSPLHLPHISPTSPPHLRCISRAPPPQSFLSPSFFAAFAGLGFSEINPKEKEINSLTQTVFYSVELMARQVRARGRATLRVRGRVRGRVTVRVRGRGAQYPPPCPGVAHGVRVREGVHQPDG